MLTVSRPDSSNSFSQPKSSNSSSFTYHVFLSFRGADTRHGFTGNLYKALSDKGIYTFMDDEELRKGEEITSALLTAIEESRIALVVLSENYASSTFCLQELVKILECVKHNGRLVWPIFYGVNPSDVRHLKGSYGEAFNKHEVRFEADKEKVQNWKVALREVADLSGWHLNQGSEYEYKFIANIVEELSKKTHRINLHIANYPVGLESHVEKLNSLLDIESNERVIMIGIHGIGGIGKTAAACAIHNLIADHFEGVCFLVNVKGSLSQNGDLVQLQKNMLSEIVGEKNIEFSGIHKGISIIKSKLKKKKVLLILDDVDELYQLQTLAGGLDWFGSGSRIIITTRDEHLLDAHGVKRKYMVKALNNKEAFKLLSWNAFKSNMIDVSYQGILDKFVKYCSGLPLALEVIGSNLFGKGLNEWESALDTYKKFPNRNIQEVLKVSYDHLDENEKGIFLDMACFFGGCELKYVQKILQNGHGLRPEYSIGVLIKRSLIKIDHSGCVIMHDLIRDMGREIVRQESLCNPGKRSRLWCYEDICDVFENNKGTDEIQAIMLNAPKNSKVQWDGNALLKMKNLRILMVRNACFSCGPKHLSNSLRILDWEQYPSSSLPSDFNPRKLIILNLSSSCLILDKPFQHFESLSEINLSNSNLERVPCVSGAPNLRKIILDRCTKLVEVHGSIGLLDKLETLNAYGCSNLRIFPDVIHSTSLKDFVLTGCLSLPNFPKILGIMEMITVLDLYGGAWFLGDETLRLSLTDEHYNYQLESGHLMFPKVDKIMKGSFGHIGKGQDQYQERASPSIPPNMTSLSILGCNLSDKYLSEWLPCFPNLEDLDLTNSYKVDQFLYAWHPCFTFLKRLNLSTNNLTDEFLSTRLPWFPNLLSLNLSETNFTILPECIKECHYLRDLDLIGCKQFREIRGMPPNIKILFATNCTSLSDQSTNILTSQALHEAGSMQFTLPEVKLPEWFAYKQASQSLSFWVRNKFPEQIALCLVFGNFDQTMFIDLLVNGIRHSSIRCPKGSRKPHIHLVHLERGRDFIREVLIGPGWNHVQVLPRVNGVLNENVSWMGVHIFKEENSAKNVRFTDPNPGKGKADYLSGTIRNHAVQLIKMWCSLLDMKVLDTNRPLKYRRSHRLHEQNWIWKGAWKIQAPVEVKILMRKVCKDALPTCMNLFRRKVIKSPLCPICKIDYETIEHVFMLCEWTRPIWFGSDLQWCVQSDYGFIEWIVQKIKKRVFADVHERSVWEHLFNRMDHDVIVEGQPFDKIMGTVGNICWAIWKGRNEYVVGSKPVDPQLALSRVKTLSKQYSHGYPLVQTATTCQGQVVEDDNKAKGKSVLMASSSSNIKENIGQDGLSLDHCTTRDTPIARSTIVKAETEQVREPNSKMETKKGETSDSVIMDTTIHNEQLTAERKKRKRNRSRCPSVRACKKPRVDKGKPTITNKCTKWKRNPMHLRLSRQLLQPYKTVYRKVHGPRHNNKANCRNACQT